MVAIAYGVTGAEMAVVRTAVKASAYTASPGDLVPCDISAGGFTVKLPSAPADGTRVAVKIVATAPASQYALTVACQASDVINKSGGSTDATLTLPSQGSIYAYQSSTAIWTVTSDDLPLGSVKTIIPDWFNVRAFGADPTGATDSTAAITAALNAAGAQGGGTVYLPWGTYLVSSALSIPPYVTLRGQTRISLPLLTSPVPPASRIVASASWAPGSATGIVTFQSKTPGGWATTAESSGLDSVMLDGSLNSSGSLNGIFFQGPVYDCHLRDVMIYQAPHDAVQAAGATESGIAPTFAYHHRWERVTAYYSGGVTGINCTNFTDSVYSECMAFGCTGPGWTIANCSNSQWLGCRAEWNTSYGFGISGASGSLTFSGCTTDANSGPGLNISSATGQSGDGGGVIWTGGKIHGSGLGGGASDYGVHITGSTVPIMLCGLNVEATNGSFGAHPATAIGISTSSNVTVTGGVLQGITTAWSDGGGNSVIKRTGCIGMTGNPGSQVVTALPDLPRPPVPAPSDQGLICWAYDPVVAASSTVATAGTLYLIGLHVREQQVITNASIYVSAPQAVTANQNFLGLYNSSGALVASTSAGAIDSALAAGGPVTQAFSSAYTAPAGMYWAGILINAGGTVPSLLRAGLISTPGAADTGNAAATYRFAVNGTGLTALPGTITPAGNSHTGAGQYWAALS